MDKTWIKIQQFLRITKLHFLAKEISSINYGLIQILKLST